MTDSTADLSKDLLEKYNIEVIPLCIVMDEKSYFDGAEIKLESRNGYGIKTKSAVYKFRPYSPESEFDWGTISFDFISGEISVDKPFLFFLFRPFR